MSTIRMLTEDVRQLSRRTCMEAGGFLDDLQRLNSQVRAMVWEGGSSAEFRAEIEALIRAIEIQCDNLYQLGISVNREVDQWEEADQWGT